MKEEMKKVQEGKFEEIKPEQPAENKENTPKQDPKKDNKNESKPLKAVKFIGRGVMYVAVGALTVLGVFAVIGAAAGKNKSDSEEEDTESEGEDEGDSENSQDEN